MLTSDLRRLATEQILSLIPTGFDREPLEEIAMKTFIKSNNRLDIQYVAKYKIRSYSYVASFGQLSSLKSGVSIRHLASTVR